MTLITVIPVTNTAARKRIAASGGAMLTQTIILDYDVEKGIVYLPIAVSCWNIAGATSLAVVNGPRDSSLSVGQPASTAARGRLRGLVRVPHPPR
jgi:hypothetical protein